MAGPKRHYGAHDFNLGEIRRFRVHIYATLVAANADVATAEARFIYVVATQQAYFGKPGAWVEVGGGAASWRAHVATVADLSTITPVAAGDATVVLDGDGNGNPAIYKYDGSSWKSVADDTRITLADGSRPFTGIPSVVDATIQVPVADADLATKKYVDDQIGGAGYATPQDVDDAIAAHEAEPDPHPVYLTAAEGTAIAQGEVAVHEGAGDPHPQYTTSAEAAAVAAGQAAAAISTHDADPLAHPGLLDAHNTDPTAHGGLEQKLNLLLSGGSENSESQLVLNFQAVLNAVPGQPVVHKAGADYWEPLSATDEKPDGAALGGASTVTPCYDSVNVTFDAGGFIDVPNVAARFDLGSVLRFPDAATNTGLFRVRKRDLALDRLWVEPAPAAEVIATAIEQIERNATVVVHGDIDLPNGRTKVDSHAVTRQAPADNQVDLDDGQDLTAVQEDDLLVLAGTSTGNDGSYAIESVGDRTVTLKPVERVTHAAVAVQEIDVSEKLVVLDSTPDLSDVAAGDRLVLSGTTDNDGRYLISKIDGIVTEADVVAIDVDNGGGQGVVTLDASADLSRFLAGDQLTLAGTFDNDGTFAIDSVNDTTKEVTLTATLPGTDAGAGGTGTVSGDIRFAYVVEPLPGADQGVVGNAEITDLDAPALPGSVFPAEQTFVDDAPIVSIDVSTGDITLDAGTDLSSVLAGDLIILTGTTDNDDPDGYEILTVNDTTKVVNVGAGTLPGTNQGAGGTADITGVRSGTDGSATVTRPNDSANLSFDTTLAAGEPGPEFYVDTAAAQDYSKTPNHWRYGRQISLDAFLVEIEEVGAYRQSVTGAVTADRRPVAAYLLDSSGGGFTFTLHASPQEGDRVLLKDVARQAGTNNITIDGNGADIEGSSTLTMDADGEAFELAYMSGEWRIV